MIKDEQITTQKRAVFVWPILREFVKDRFRIGEEEAQEIETNLCKHKYEFFELLGKGKTRHVFWFIIKHFDLDLMEKPFELVNELSRDFRKYYEDKTKHTTPELFDYQYFTLTGETRI